MEIPRIHGRSRELGLLRTRWDQPAASWGWVVGPPGVGKTATVLHAGADYRFVYHRAPPLSDPQQRQALGTSLASIQSEGEGGVTHAPRGSATPTGKDPSTTGTGPRGGTATQPDGALPTWEQLFQELVEASGGPRPTVLVVDDAHRWEEARARWAPALDRALARAREAGTPVHVTLVAPEVPAREAAEPTVPTLTLSPLPFRSAAPFLPGATARERLRSYAVFGGLPGVLSLLDPSATLGTNVRRLLLAPGAPLQNLPLTWLERTFQTPTRYAAILTALASGEGDWGRVQAGVPDLSASGQAGPYLKRLEEVGLVDVRRSLDASPRTRNRRYRIVDPFVAAWFRFVLPLRERLALGGGEALYAASVRPRLAGQVASCFGQVCRDFMADDAVEKLDANAREWGSLWGPGYEIPVAGVLASGAPFYGALATDDPLDAAAAFGELDRQVRETRYGFGRERRLRILFVPGDAPLTLLREAARRRDALVVTLDDLAGELEPA